MTILAARFTEEGVAIVADGRRVDASDYSTISNCTQKLFFAKHPDFRFVFGCAGGVAFEAIKCKDFDFANEILVSIEEMTGDRFLTVGNFLTRLNASLFSKVFRCVGGLRADRPGYNGNFAAFLLVGYFKGEPTQIAVAICCEDGFLTTPVCTHLSVPPTMTLIVVSGSATIANQVDDDAVKTLTEAQRMLHEFAKRCVDGSEAPEECGGYGGHIHLAALTPNSSEWIIPPVQKMDSVK